MTEETQHPAAQISTKILFAKDEGVLTWRDTVGGLVGKVEDTFFKQPRGGALFCLLAPQRRLTVRLAGRCTSKDGSGCCRDNVDQGQTGLCL